MVRWLRKEVSHILNENIKAVRQSKGLSQEELAIKLNVVRQTVSKWERGLSVPDSEMLVSVSEVLETPVSILLGETITEKASEDLKVISEKLEVINLQLARQKAARQNVLHWTFVLHGICSTEYRGKDAAGGFRLFSDPGVDPTGYDTVFIGYPVWWYEMPMIMDTFIFPVSQLSRLTHMRAAGMAEPMMLSGNWNRTQMFWKDLPYAARTPVKTVQDFEGVRVSKRGRTVQKMKCPDDCTYSVDGFCM